jgi:hypothetical protein
VKRLVILLLAAGVLLAAGCGGGAEDRYKNSSRDKPKSTLRTPREGPAEPPGLSRRG